MARWQGDAVKAHAAFNVARGEVAKMVEQEPNSAAPLSLLGMIDAGLGRKEDALRAGRRACELLPISKDASMAWRSRLISRKSTRGRAKKISPSSSSPR